MNNKDDTYIQPLQQMYKFIPLLDTSLHFYKGKIRITKHNWELDNFIHKFYDNDFNLIKEEIGIVSNKYDINKYDGNKWTKIDLTN